MTRYLVILPLLLAAASTTSGQPMTVFSPFGGGNSAAGGAFLVDNQVAPSARSQQVYGASDFSRVCTGVQCQFVDSPLWITGFSFTAINVPADFNVDLQNIRIDLSTSSKMPDGLSSTFAENVGADNTVVYSGLLRLTIETFVSLQTPFLFDPSQGNLLMDVRNFATPRPPGFGVRQFEGENTRGDTISQIIALDVNSSTARFVDTGGMVTRFQVTPIPEPSTVLLMVLAGSALVVSGWRRRQSVLRCKDARTQRATDSE